MNTTNDYTEMRTPTGHLLGVPEYDYYAQYGDEIEIRVKGETDVFVYNTDGFLLRVRECVCHICEDSKTTQSNEDTRYETEYENNTAMWFEFLRLVNGMRPDYFNTVEIRYTREFSQFTHTFTPEEAKTIVREENTER